MWIVASDFDRTISDDKDAFRVREEVRDKINEFSKYWGFFVVTGRERRFMEALAPGLKPTGWVLENGCLILAGDREILNVPPGWFSLRQRVITELKGRGIKFSSGEAILYLSDVLEDDLPRIDGVNFERNRNDVMVLPSGIDKGSGLLRALKEMGLNGTIIAVGDGENDASLFRVAQFRVAVKNAVDPLKSMADLVLDREDGLGVVKLLDMILSGDFLKNVKVH